MKLNCFLSHLVIMVMFVSGLMLAQNIVTGGISGTVTDSSGAVVPNAQITLTNKSSGEVQTTKTSAAGLYTFSLLKPG
ncbi:MAG: carboxypeptidase-like regulatory domain-containing protein, partial [Candidatus Sulfotelmatobacter sp.]